MKVLLIDNYDSFTFNLFQYLAELGGEPVVFRNDEIDLAGIRALAPTHIVLSPGPGRPDRPEDFGICARVIEALSPGLPTLGVCLGHQGLVVAFGGRVVGAPKIFHGKSSTLVHFDDPLFRGIPSPFQAMRYHSLVGERPSLPEDLQIIAETLDDGLVMAVRHRRWPLLGVQFHPESIGTPHGKRMLANFLEMTGAGSPRP